MSGPWSTTQPTFPAQAGQTGLVQFQAVALNSSGQAVSPSSNGSIVGVLQNNPTAVGQACDIQGAFITKAVFGGSVTVGNPVKINASGQFVTASAADLAAGFAVGYCIVNGGGVGQIGSVLLSTMGAGQAAITGSDTLTASGASNLNTLRTLTNTTGTFAYTLANGLYVGQRKTFAEIGGSGTGTLTLATAYGSNSTVWVFHAVGQEIEFEWRVDSSSTGWAPVRKIRAGALTVVVGTTVLTGYRLTETYNLSVTGTVTSSGAQNIPTPDLTGEYIRILTTTAASIPNGTIGIAGFTKALVAASNLAGINATTCTASFLANGPLGSWDNEQLTTATYS